jgi:threonine/homoserine/homoserine lactone efflux protein
MAGQGLLPGLPELAVFASAVFVLNATPGVDFVLTVSRTLQGGVRAGVAAALGINLGCVVHALAAAFGLAALLVLYPAAFAFIQWAGAAYLVWLGLGMLRQAWRGAAGHAGDAGDAGQALTQAKVARPFAADLRTGLLTNVLNPKVALFFLAFLPQFVPADSPHKTLSFLLLGAWFVVQGFLFLMGLVLLASRLKKLRASPRASQLLNAVGGVLFIALAVRLLKEKPALVTLA